MSKRTLEEILQSTSDTLFPAELGEAQVEIDSTGCDEDTPLHVLIWRNDTESAIALITNGAPINAVGDMGETPLHIALRKENKAIIKALLNAGAKVNILSEFGKTSIDIVKAKNIQLKQYQQT